jgi:hypothetical protein
MGMGMGMGHQQPIYQPIPYQWVYIHNIIVAINIDFWSFSFQISLLIVFLKLIHLIANCVSFIVNFGFQSCLILFCANSHSIPFICSKCLRLTILLNFFS